MSALKKTLVSLLILVLFVTVANISSFPSRADQVSPIVDVRSNVNIMDGGMVEVNETFELSSPNSSYAMQDFFVGFPSLLSRFIDYHRFYQSSNGTWIALTSRPEEANNATIEGFRVTLLKPMVLSSSQNLSLRAVFLFSGTVYAAGLQLSVGFPLYPSLAHYVKRHGSGETSPGSHALKR